MINDDARDTKREVRLDIFDSVHQVYLWGYDVTDCEMVGLGVRLDPRSLAAMEAFMKATVVLSVGGQAEAEGLLLGALPLWPKWLALLRQPRVLYGTTMVAEVVGVTEQEAKSILVVAVLRPLADGGRRK